MESSHFGVFIPFGAFIMVVCIVWITNHYEQQKVRYRSEVQKELIARFTNPQDLAAFLESEASRKLFGSLSTARDPRQELYHRTIGMITGGLVTGSIGTAFLTMGMQWRQGMIVPGMILTGVGGSLLLAAGIGYFLSKKWGLDKSTHEVAQRT